jgi:hypothetical protein
MWAAGGEPPEGDRPLRITRPVAAKTSPTTTNSQRPSAIAAPRTLSASANPPPSPAETKALTMSEAAAIQAGSAPIE